MCHIVGFLFAMTNPQIGILEKEVLNMVAFEINETLHAWVLSNTPNVLDRLDITCIIFF